jgi:hypothetical protein
MSDTVAIFTGDIVDGALVGAFSAGGIVETARYHKDPNRD